MNGRPTEPQPKKGPDSLPADGVETKVETTGLSGVASGTSPRSPKTHRRTSRSRQLRLRLIDELYDPLSKLPPHIRNQAFGFYVAAGIHQIDLPKLVDLLPELQAIRKELNVTNKVLLKNPGSIPVSRFDPVLKRLDLLLGGPL